MSTDACPERGEWTRLLHATMSEDRQRQLEAHLERCDECRRQLDNLAGGLPLPEVTPADRAVGATLLESVVRRMLANEPGVAEQREKADSLELPSGMLEPSHCRGSIGRIGHFEVQGVVGRGGLGAVLRAFDPRLNRVVAIKIPAPELVANPMVRKRFQREAQAAAAVTHEHVVRIYSVDEARGIPFLVMEYIDGGSLQQEIDRRGALEVREVVRAGMQLSQGLAAAHKQGLVHRDIKPANILLAGGLERVKLTDFGLARAVDDVTLTQSGVVAGTPQYMSPEQARGETVDSRSDLFSLGSVLYTMCTGRAAFRAESPLAVLRRICDDEPRPIRQLNPEVPVWLAEIVETLLRKHPDERYQSAEEVAGALESWLAHLQQPSQAAVIETFIAPDKQLLEAGRSSRRGRWGAGAWLLLLLVPLVLGSLYVVRTWRRDHLVQLENAVARQNALARQNAPARLDLVIEGGDWLQLQCLEGPSLSIETELGLVPEIRGSGTDLLIGRRTELGPPRRTYLSFQLPAGRYRMDLLGASLGGRTNLGSHTVILFAGDKGQVQLADGRLNAAKAGESAATEFASRPSPERSEIQLPGMVHTLAFASDSQSLLVGGNGFSVRRISRRPGQTWPQAFAQSAGPGGQGVSTGPSPFADNPADISRLAFVSDDQFVVASASTQKEHTFLLRSLRDPLSIQRFSGHSGTIWKLTRAADAPVFASAGVGGLVLVWHREKGLIARIDTQEKMVFGIALSPDGKWLVTSGDSKSIAVWDVVTGRQERKFEFHTAAGIAFVAGGRGVITAGSDFRVYLWSFPDMTVRMRYLGHTGVITDLAVDEARGRLATGSDDLTVRVWNLGTTESLGVYTRHTRKITQVAFSPDGECLASGSEDGTVRLWNPSVGSALGSPFRSPPAMPSNAQSVPQVERPDGSAGAEIAPQPESGSPSSASETDRPEAVPLPGPSDTP